MRPLKKRSISFKIKARESRFSGINRRNMLNILRIEIRTQRPAEITPYGNKKMPYVEIYFVPYAIYCIKNQ